MSDDNSDTAAESDDDYIYICTGNLHRSPSVSPSGDSESFEATDEIEPMERELELYPDKFLKLNPDGTLATDVEVERELTPEEKLAKQYRMER